MKRKSATVLLLLLLFCSILTDAAVNLQDSGSEYNAEQTEKTMRENTGNLWEVLSGNHWAPDVQPRSLSAGRLLSMPGKRNNAVFMKNLIEKALFAFFTAFHCGAGKCFAVILMIYMTFTWKLSGWMRILHQADGKKRAFA